MFEKFKYQYANQIAAAVKHVFNGLRQKVNYESQLKQIIMIQEKLKRLQQRFVL